MEKILLSKRKKAFDVTFCLVSSLNICNSK